MQKEALVLVIWKNPAVEGCHAAQLRKKRFKVANLQTVCWHGASYDPWMLHRVLFFLLAAAALTALPKPVSAQVYFGASASGGITYISTDGGLTFIPQSPRAKHDSRIDSRLVKAARIADARAFPHSKLRCWQYVKNALLEAGAVRAYPSTNYACQAGSELTSRYGFVRLPIQNPYSAPVGAVLVYAGGGAGHVEFRTEHGFASDYRSAWRCRYKLIGVYAMLSA